MNQSTPTTQIVAQWITSLAISVVCCAVLFIVFAGYIVELKSSINLVTLRLEVAQEKYLNLREELDGLKAELSRNTDRVTAEQPVSAADPVEAEGEPEPEVQVAPPAMGVEITEPAPLDPDESKSIAPVLAAPQIMAPLLGADQKKVEPSSTPAAKSP